MKYWYSMIALCINVTLLRKCLQTIDDLLFHFVLSYKAV